MFHIHRQVLVANALLFGVLTLSAGLSAADENLVADDSSTDNSFGIETGYTHDSGKYGTRLETRTSTVPLTLYYDAGHYEFEASLPYTHNSGPAGSIAGRVRHQTTQTRPIVDVQGIGDSSLGVTRDIINNERSGFSFDLGANVKLATGDVHRGLGTGANDYALFTDVSQTIKRLTLTGTAGYTKNGSKGLVVVNGYQENLRFKNSAYGQLDGSVRLYDQTKLGLSYFAQQPIAGKDPEEESTGYLSLDLGKHVDLNLYVLKGFTKASPDRGYGATVRAYF